MAQIQINSTNPTTMSRQILINGVDFSHETYADSIKLVEVGEGDLAEVGLQVTFAVSKLTIDNEADVQLTDHLPEAAAMVRSAIAESA